MPRGVGGKDPQHPEAKAGVVTICQYLNRNPRKSFAGFKYPVVGPHDLDIDSSPLKGRPSKYLSRLRIVFSGPRGAVPAPRNPETQAVKIILIGAFRSRPSRRQIILDSSVWMIFQVVANATAKKLSHCRVIDKTSPLKGLFFGFWERELDRVQGIEDYH